jgi:Tol biopolymer transport system component
LVKENSIAVPVSQVDKFRMIGIRTIALGILVTANFAAATAAGSGTLLVDTYGKLLAIGTDGATRVVTESMISAVFSRDGQNLAFTRNEDPRATSSAQVLSVISVNGGVATQIARVESGTHFESIGWLPDGSAIIFEGKGGHLFLAKLPFNEAPRDLGPWYQGFSISPDGLKIVHAVNAPVTGLEVLDVASGRRTLIHKTSKVVWSAQFSPDGQWIAYEMTLRDPPRATDDEPDCTPPTIGLHLYSLRADRDTAVRIAAPKDWDNVKSFSWSPDSKRLAITVGTTDCDYPGSANGVFVTSLPLRTQSKVSDGDMAFDPVFSPDGSSIAYIDFSDSPAKLIRYDIATGSRTLIRRATQTDNFYRLLDWR